MPTILTPIALALVPDLLRKRGVEVGRKGLHEALARGTVPGRPGGRRRVLTPEDLDAAERYFRGLGGRGRPKGGAAGVERAGRRE